MTNIVTPKQTGFINTLLSERVVSSPLAQLARNVATTKDASAVITALLIAPRKPRPAFAAARVSPEYAEYLDLINAAEVSKYAVPTKYLRLAFPELGALLSNDLLFLEVKNYNGKRYLSRLSGAPGGFSRHRLPLATSVGLLRFIKGRHVEFATLFGQHYSVCGRCAAELTDAESRATGFGPECRKVFGL